MHGDADGLVPVAASRMIHERAGSDDKTIRIWEGLYHEILNEPEQHQVMDVVVAWLDERSG
jgi:alpha-beta hydrolase superfamily lysophospholipase